MDSLNQISKDQNTEEALQWLKAQHRLYSLAKIYQNLYFALCVCVVVLLSVLRNFYECELLSQVSLLYSIMLYFLRPFLLHCKQAKVDLAARIQQLFDTTLYQLEWEDWLCGDKPNADDIRKYANEIPSSEKFTDWYDKRMNQVSLKVATIICIRSNVSYDSRLRTQCKKWILTGTVIVALVSFLFNFSRNETFMNILLYQVAPLCPIVIWGWDIHQQFNKNLSSLERIRKKLDDALEKGKAEKVTNKQLCQLQNMLFLYRKSNCLIPDWIYNLSRPKNEKEMADMVGTYINQYKEE